MHIAKTADAIRSVKPVDLTFIVARSTALEALYTLDIARSLAIRHWKDQPIAIYLVSHLPVSVSYILSLCRPISSSIGGLVVKLAVAIRSSPSDYVGQPRVRFPADALCSPSGIYFCNFALCDLGTPQLSFLDSQKGTCH